MAKTAELKKKYFAYGLAKKHQNFKIAKFKIDKLKF
jgi:hypothetical protein